ncbi:uncharacterized protein LOC106660550 [Trichogramma pretiosum]|uniref:uncharacterized protein LOC106660550 n=1 Tax=Trichogramma pretiosum TaxID=7493 RepID=UPI0006C9D171|nr:uncharacterized protein LOC106660550 [Trichogramma pretiosum]
MAAMENNSTIEAIEYLNNDCLREIFYHLPIIDLLQMEKVCKRWTYVARDSWGRITGADFYDFLQEDDDTLDEEIIQNVWKRFAMRITGVELDITCRTFDLNAFFPACCKIKSLRWELPDEESWITTLSRCIEKLENLDLTISPDQDFIPNIGDDPFFTAFVGLLQGAKLENLKNFRLNVKHTNCSDKILEIVEWLPRHLKSLKIINTCIFSCKLLSEILEKFTQLEYLSLSTGIFRPQINLENTRVFLPRTLKYLCIDKLTFNSLCYDFICDLTALEGVRLVGGEMTHEGLIKVAKYCEHLKSIDLTKVDGLNEAAFAIALPIMKKLETLKFREFSDMEGRFFRDLLGLKDVHIAKCFNVLPVNVCDLLHSSKDLSRIIYQCASSEARMLIETAIQCCVDRAPDNFLNFIIKGVFTDCDRFDDFYPCLKVRIITDHSVPHNFGHINEHYNEGNEYYV